MEKYIMYFALLVPGDNGRTEEKVWCLLEVSRSLLIEVASKQPVIFRVLSIYSDWQ